MDTNYNLPAGLSIGGKISPAYAEILSPAALAFFAKLARKFEPTRQALLTARAVRQKQFDAGTLPDFLPATRHIRDGNWVVAPVPAFCCSMTLVTGRTNTLLAAAALPPTTIVGFPENAISIQRQALMPPLIAAKPFFVVPNKLPCTVNVWVCPACSAPL